MRNAKYTMARSKYFYNKNTLRYERFKLTSQQKFARFAFGLLVIAVYTGFVFYLTPGKSDKLIAKELEQMKSRYNEMNYQVDLMNKALENIHDRDNAIYRQVLEMDPTDDYVWEGGRGGSDKYADLRSLTDRELLEASSKKIQKLRHKLTVTAKSQDAVLQRAMEKEDMLSSIPSIRPIRFLKKRITALSGFGYRTHPVFKRRKMHTGIDFGARRGTPIYATGKGKVIRVEYKKTGYGRNVVINHGYGYKTLYAHMSKFNCRVGQKVKRGDIIGYVGNTGTSTSPHVHYEVIYKGKKINPLPFCLDGLSTQEYQEFITAATAENQAMSIE